MRFLAIFTIVSLISIASPASAGFFSSQPKLDPVNRTIQHFHPYQWNNTSEGHDLGMINVDKMIENALQKKLIKKVSIQGDVGYVDIYEKFKHLSFRDQNVIAHAVHSLYKAKKGKDYTLFLIRDKNADLFGSYTRYGLDIY